MKKQLLLLSSLFAMNCMYASVTQLPQQKVEQAAQDDVKIHRVAMGETMTMIAKKYMVLPQDIYDINPGSAEGLSAGMALKIPVGKKVKVEAEQKNLDYQLVDASEIVRQKEKKQQQEIYPVETQAKKAVAAQETAVALVQPQVQEEASVQNVNHDVRPGENLSGLARKYNTTVADITAANEKTLKRGLQAGQKLVIPATGIAETASTENTAVAAATTVITEEKQEFTGTHHVKQGETLHSLARKYNTTVAEITSANEKLLKRGLQAGQTLVVPAAATQVEETAVTSAETVVVPNHASYSEEPTGTTEHKVESGETLHGLARKYNTSVEAITAANKQKLKRGLQTGQLIRIPVVMTGLAAHVNEQ